MSNQTTVKMSLPTASRVRARLRGAVVKTARDFGRETVKKIRQSKPSGRIYKSRRKGFHRASSPGQRPAIDTANLVRSVTFKETRGELEAMVFIAPRPNPENGMSAERYAEILQTNLNRPIMTAKDAKDFEGEFVKNIQKEAVKLFS